jgi:hypothetical protein
MTSTVVDSCHMGGRREMSSLANEAHIHSRAYTRANTLSDNTVLVAESERSKNVIVYTIIILIFRQQ